MKASKIYRTVYSLKIPEKDRRSLIRAALRQRGDVLMALEAAARRQTTS